MLRAEERKESRHTIEQFINQHKVVLHGLFVKLSKVALPQRNKPVEELKDQRGIGIALRHGDQVDILVLDMAEGSRAQGKDRRADLRIGDDLDAEDVGKTRATIAAEGAENQVLALLIKDQDPREHGE